MFRHISQCFLQRFLFYYLNSLVCMVIASRQPLENLFLSKTYLSVSCHELLSENLPCPMRADLIGLLARWFKILKPLRHPRTGLRLSSVYKLSLRHTRRVTNRHTCPKTYTQSRLKNRYKRTLKIITHLKSPVQCGHSPQRPATTAQTLRSH